MSESTDTNEMARMKKRWHDENVKLSGVFALSIGSASSWVYQGSDPSVRTVLGCC